MILASFFLNPVENDYFKPVDFAKAAGLASFSINSFIIAALVLGAAFFAFSSAKMNMLQRALLLAAVAAIDLAVVNFPYIQTVPRENYYNPAIAQTIKKDSPNELERPRIFSSTRHPAISGNNLAAYGLRNALGFHDNEVATYRVFKEQLQNQAMLDIMNVGYIIYDSDRGTSIQKNPGDLGRTRMYYEWEVMDNQDEIINKLKDNDFDYRNILLVENNPAINANAGVGTVKTANYRMDEISFDVESSQSGLLFISENYHKFWKAKVNGNDAKIHRAFSTFMAVEIPEGKSIVKLAYISDNLRKSFVLGAIGLILLGVAAVIYFIRGRNEKSFF